MTHVIWEVTWAGAAATGIAPIIGIIGAPSILSVF